MEPPLRCRPPSDRAPRAGPAPGGRVPRWSAVLLVVGALLAIAGPARAADCALADFAYNGMCGPEFESPAWGDAAGWTDPSKYSTIQLADISGDGRAELIGRNDQGIEIWAFDTTLGQWRPALDDKGHPQVLRDLRSPLPTEDVRGSWRDPETYSTIQTADLYGGGAAEIIANRAPAGTDVYYFTPALGTQNSIQGGSWEVISTTPGLIPADPPPQDFLNFKAIDANNANTGLAILTVQNTYWLWESGTGFTAPGPTNAPVTTDPRYYLNSTSGLFPQLGSAPGAPPTLVPSHVFRTPDGVAVEDLDDVGQMALLGPPPSSTPQCLDTPHSCSPFPDDGCQGAGNCLGSNPAYYETLQTANHLLGPNDTNGYVLGRLRDGLHVFALKPFTSSTGQPTLGWDASIPVLTDLADPSSGLPQPGEWSTIRTGDVTGDGKTDVVARWDGQLRAWELNSDSSGRLSWTQLPANPALNLGGSMWDTNPAYYSTIEVGPVAGPGQPDGVVARGPFGIRTWFYNRGGSGGWTSWAPTDTSSYPQFSGGQANAWSQLNALAQNNLIGPSGTVRDVWTAATKPTDTDLQNLSNGILVFAGCTGATSANPPTYSSCAVPSGSTYAFTADDWTAVVNQILAEIYDARQVTDFFTQLGSLNDDVFLAKEAELPAIGDSVAALGQSAGNTTTAVSPQSFFSAGFGIAGSLAGLVDPGAGAALGVASYIAGIIPSATADVNQPPFNTTLNQLQDDLANAITQAGQAVDAQSYEVRQNYGMLRMVSELTAPSGPWHAINDGGVRGSMDQGFALWAYKQLLPTMLERDVITGCTDASDDPDQIQCNYTPWPGSVSDGPNAFTTLNTPHTVGGSVMNAWPCSSNWTNVCNFTQPPTGLVNGVPGTDIGTKVWGKPADTCIYNGTPLTEWTFDCNLGIPPALSTDATGGPANGWHFPTCHGSPAIMFDDDFSPPFPTGTCTSLTSARVETVGADTVKLQATVGLPPRANVRSVTLDAKRLLHEPGGRPSLVRRRSGRPLGKVRLAQTSGAGRATVSTVLQSRGGPRIAVRLRRAGQRQRRLTLTIRRVRVAHPHACHELPASTALEVRPFTLATSLRFRTRRAAHHVKLPATWTCTRSKGGKVTGLRTVRPPASARHRRLHVSIAGPGTVVPGSRVAYTVRVRNTSPPRRGEQAGASGQRRGVAVSGVHVRLTLGRAGERRPDGVRRRGPVLRRVPRLRAGQTKVLRIPVRIPRALQDAAIDRLCVNAGAIAHSVRAAGARACSLIGAGPVGLG